MKKRYTALKRKLCCIMVAIMLLGSIFFTIYQAIEYEESISQYKVNLSAIDTVSENEEVSAISNAYDMINSVSDEHRTGFYGALVSPQGETVVETCDFIIVEKCLHDGENIDRRILLLEEDFLSKAKITYNYYDEETLTNNDYFMSVVKIMGYWNWTDIEIVGTCDLNYIYPEKIKINLTDCLDNKMGYVEFVPYENKTHLGTTSVSEWLEGYTCVSQIYTYYTSPMLELNPGEYQTNYSSHSKDYLNFDIMDKWLNMEAKKISQKLYERTLIKASESVEGSWHELGSSILPDNRLNNLSVFIKYDYFTSADDDGYSFQYVFVYHPILMVMEDMWMIYLIIFVFTLISLVIISVLINKAYEQQLINETNRQELTRGIAHELKTPLAITKGYIENWQYLEENEKTETKETIINEIEQMNRLVTDFLELSRLEAKKKEMHWEDVDLYSLTLSVIQRLNPIIEERKLNVTVLPDKCENAENFIVEADLEMIRTAIVNYVSNAVKYADKEIVIEFSEKNKTVVFDIENDGATMDKKKISRVWDDFYKDSEYNRSTIGSSGLGLAITKNIFILHNAKYGCDCDNGKTHFVFEINKKRRL